MIWNNHIENRSCSISDLAKPLTVRWLPSLGRDSWWLLGTRSGPQINSQGVRPSACQDSIDVEIFISKWASSYMVVSMGFPS